MLKLPLRASSLPIPAAMRIESPDMCTVAFVSAMSRRSSEMFQCDGVLTVSSGTVSLSATSRRAPFNSARSMCTVSSLRLMLRLRSDSSPTRPLTHAEGTKRAVLSLVSANSRRSITTLPSNNGRRRTLTVSCRASAIVSVMLRRESLGCVAMNPLTVRSNGKRRRTRSTRTVIPVDSEAYEATCLTAQFCTGGT